jgi:hypothetical protein
MVDGPTVVADRRAGHLKVLLKFRGIQNGL